MSIPEAPLVARVRSELETLRDWAAEQNAGNAFADQVRQWAVAHLGRLDDRVCPVCGERYINAGAHAEACRGKPGPVRPEAVSPRKERAS